MAETVFPTCQELLSKYRFQECEILVQEALAQGDITAEAAGFQSVKSLYCFRLLEASRLDHERSKLPTTSEPLMGPTGDRIPVFIDIAKVTSADLACRVAKMALGNVSANVAEVFDHLAYFEKTDPTVKRDYKRQALFLAICVGIILCWLTWSEIPCQHNN